MLAGPSLSERQQEVTIPNRAGLWRRGESKGFGEKKPVNFAAGRGSLSLTSARPLR